MKTLGYILPVALAICLGAASCSDDVDGGKLTPTNIVSSTLEDGSKIDVLLHKTMTVKYSHPVEVVNPAGITLNGVPVEAKANVCELILNLNPLPDTEYTLTIAPGAVKRFEKTDQVPEGLTVHFTTLPAPVIADAPCNPAANEPAKALYSRLRSIYGSKTATGTAGGGVWDTGYYDFITGATGSAPAFVAFDFAEINNTKKPVAYGDISKVREVYEAGGVPVLNWNWAVPRVNKPGASLTTEVKDFVASRIFEEGTWENGVAREHVAKLAGYLRQLQDAGVAAVFCPIPDGVTDYSGDALCWWGNEGIDVYNRLWKWLYATLTDTYGINNLLWQWTPAMLDNAKAALWQTVAKSYPGDRYVDLVGVPVSSDTDLFTDFSTWYTARQAAGGVKMVGMTGCGMLPDVEANLASSASWLYFIQNADIDTGEYGFFKYSPVATWSKLIASPAVLDREGLKAIEK